MGAWFTDWQSLKDVTPGSPFLEQLNSAPWPEGLRLTSIYSCWDEFMVPYRTSKVDNAVNVEFCQHKVMHFDPFWDTIVYDRIRSALEGLGAEAPSFY